MDIEKRFRGEGGYVFVSHSHLDIKEVREVRNFLEQSGIEPILFYLRSMENGGDEKVALLRSLIYEEIDSREFFLYLDSEHAQASKWVQEELAYVKQTAPNKVFFASLSEGVESVKKKLNAFLQRMRVFVSYSHRDFELATRLKKSFLKKDFRVYEEEENFAGSKWAEEVEKTLDEVSKAGVIVALLTERSIRSMYMQFQLNYAVRKGGRIVPIAVGDFELPKEMSNLLFLRLRSDCTEEEINEIVEKIRKEQWTKG